MTNQKDQTISTAEQLEIETLLNDMATVALESSNREKFDLDGLVKIGKISERSRRYAADGAMLFKAMLSGFLRDVNKEIGNDTLQAAIITQWAWKEASRYINDMIAIRAHDQHSQKLMALAAEHHRKVSLEELNKQQETQCPHKITVTE